MQVRDSAAEQSVSGLERRRFAVEYPGWVEAGLAKRVVMLRLNYSASGLQHSDLAVQDSWSRSGQCGSARGLSEG